MSGRKQSWEGTLLLFVITLTVLLGAAFNLGAIYHFAVPWLAILIISAAFALLWRYLRRPKAGISDDS